MKNIKNKIKKFNDFIADKLSYLLSIMATFYIITLLVAIPLFYSQPTSFVAWASYLCSVVFQGIALPVLGYTARKAGDKTDLMLKDMVRMTKHIERLVSMVEAQQEHIGEEIDEIKEDLEKENDERKI